MQNPLTVRSRSSCTFSSMIFGSHSPASRPAANPGGPLSPWTQPPCNMHTPCGTGWWGLGQEQKNKKTNRSWSNIKTFKKNICMEGHMHFSGAWGSSSLPKPVRFRRSYFKMSVDTRKLQNYELLMDLRSIAMQLHWAFTRTCKKTSRGLRNRIVTPVANNNWELNHVTGPEKRKDNSGATWRCFIMHC